MTRRCREKRSEPAYRRDETDAALRPAEMCEIKSDEGAEPGLHIGREKIHPVETVATLWRRRRMQRSSRLTIVRGQFALMGIFRAKLQPGHGDRHVPA